MFWAKNHRALGSLGEKIVDDWMTQKLGCRILEKNLRIQKREIDRIYSYKNYICISEIKLRTAPKFLNLFELVSWLDSSFMESVQRSSQIRFMYALKSSLQLQHPQNSILVRIFIVIRTNSTPLLSAGLSPLDGRGFRGSVHAEWVPNLCSVQKDCMIFSLVPEVMES